MNIAFAPLVGMLLGLLCRQWMAADETIILYGFVAFAPYFLSLLSDSEESGSDDVFVFGLFMLSGFVIGTQCF